MVDCDELGLDKHRQATSLWQVRNSLELVKCHSVNVTEEIGVVNNEKFVKTQAFKAQ